MLKSMMIKASLGALMLALASTAGDAAEIKSIAILTPEQGTDFGWNQQGVAAAKAAGEKAGVEVTVAEGLGYGDVRATMRELAADGASLLIAHASGYNTSAPEIAAETGVPVAIVDRPDLLKPGLIADYTLSGHEGAYLAGRLAAKMTPHRHGRHRRLGRAAVLELAIGRLRPGREGGEAGGEDPLRRDRPGRLQRRGRRQAGDGIGDRGRGRHHLRPGQRVELRHDPGGRDQQGDRRRQGLFHRRDRRQVQHRQGQSRCPPWSGTSPRSTRR